MRILLWITAILALFTAAVHIFVGTPEISGPLLKTSGMPQMIVLLLYACWHLVSVTLAVSAFAFAYVAGSGRKPQHRALARIVSFMWICFGGVFVVVALAYSGMPMLLELPQWILLFPVGILGWISAPPKVLG